MSYPDSGMGSDGNSSTTEVAKEQAGRLGQTAAGAGGQVAQTAKEQAQNVVGEARQQARDLVGEARMQVRDQAGSQKGRAVQGLHALGDELEQMAQSSGQSGLAAEVARQASSRTRELAHYLDRHEPGDLLEEVRSYARRRPVVFLAGAAVAGVVAGRLTRGLASGGDDSTVTQPELEGAPAMPAADLTAGSYRGQAEAVYPPVPEPGVRYDPVPDPDQALGRR
jgi:hypothetical protein